MKPRNKELQPLKMIIKYKYSYSYSYSYKFICLRLLPKQLLLIFLSQMQKGSYLLLYYIILYSIY